MEAEGLAAALAGALVETEAVATALAGALVGAAPLTL